MGKILVVATWYPSRDRPAEAGFNEDHARLLAKDNRVVVLHVRLGSSEPAANEWRNGLRVLRRSLNPQRPASVLAVRHELARLARGADVVHTMAFSAALVQVLSPPPGPWVHTEHWRGVREPAGEARWWRRTAWLRHILALPDCVTGVSQTLCDAMGPFTGPRPLLVTPPLVLVPDDVEEPSPGPLRMAAIGALTDGKDPVLAVETLALLRTRGIAATLTWVGDGPLRDLVDVRAHELGVESALTITGTLAHAQVGGVLADSHLLLLPTKGETFCLAAAEALGAGRPVVIGAVGGQREFITEANGVLVEERTALAYADAVERVWRGQQAGRYPPEALREPIARRFGPSSVGAALAAAHATARDERRRRSRPAALRNSGATR